MPRYHDALPPVSGFSGADDYRRSVAADIRQLREQGDRLDPSITEALATALPDALEAHIELVARRAGAGAVRRCHGDLHLRNIVLIDGKPVRSTPSSSPSAWPASTCSTISPSR